MSWIKCPQCGELRKFENVLAGDHWLSPPCWKCGHEIPPRLADEDEDPAQSDGPGAGESMEG